MTEPVLFEERTAANGKRLGIARLNAEKVLNSLNQRMIDLLGPQLSAWAADPGLACVVLEGSGDKAFCAGGDVVSLYRAIKADLEQGVATATRFFESEYRLDYQIRTYPKPILCWGHGIVMGGGLGLMSGASHRVVTERSRIAMPEITIGLYPDVGGTWFLNRMPGRVGLYLGLTGSSINAADALYVDLADYCIGADQHAALHKALLRMAWDDEPEANRGQLSLLLREFADVSHGLRPAANVLEHLDFIDHVTDHSSVEGILETLREAGDQDDWIAAGARALEQGSPTSARVILEQYRRGKYLSLKETFVRELNMSVQFMRHHDFLEGVRALLVDKDRRPHWQPATLEGVTDGLVAAHFQPPPGLARSPLEDL